MAYAPRRAGSIKVSSQSILMSGTDFSKSSVYGWWGGRQTLHRVTRVGGARLGLANSQAVRMLFWGRTGA